MWLRKKFKISSCPQIIQPHKPHLILFPQIIYLFDDRNSKQFKEKFVFANDTFYEVRSIPQKIPTILYSV